MKWTMIGALTMVVAPCSALAENRANLLPTELIRALKAADPIQFQNIGLSALSPSSIRVVRCAGPDEEPTEFECIWLMRRSHGWTRHKNWFAVDGTGWHLIG